MAKHARGLICLALTRARCEALDLPLMTQVNGARLQTAFTVSIEAKDGVTTGISAADRAHSIAVAISPEKGRNDIVTPGHVFPLMAQDGGCLIRAGHTEASVDIARLGGLMPAAVICEIMNEDGSMARLPDLVTFAQQHGVKVGTIADLIAYRRRTEKLVRRTEQGTIADREGTHWRVMAYENTIDRVEHVVAIKGEIASDRPVLVRVHAVDVFADVINGGHAETLHAAMKQISMAGAGVVVLIRESRPGSIAERVRQIGVRIEPQLREYGTGAQILADLGVRDMILLSNHNFAVVGLEGYGLNIVGQMPIDDSAKP
jgi:3,4-dihydroxy 2-butanone 4-phosphate synthase/GTP cyclohydrolase II